MSHGVDYKGHTIIYENGIYWLAVNPIRKYLTMQDCMNEVDKITKALDQNIQNLREIIKRNPGR